MPAEAIQSDAALLFDCTHPCCWNRSYWPGLCADCHDRVCQLQEQWAREELIDADAE